MYFKWLQKDNPAGTVEKFPELKNKFETSVPGLYCVGDLTGIPLIKLASESGHELVDQLRQDEQFAGDRESSTGEEVYDLVIVGAGPAGIAACLHAAELGFRHLVLEASRKFNTIANFPAGKPIYVTPEEPPMKSALVFSDGNKESLLEELAADIEGKPLPVRQGEMVHRIVKESGSFVVETAKGSYRALRVIVAIGKTGNARRLGVPGENLPKVFTRLIDPAEYENADILVAGGGDSAVEAAVALAQNGSRVTFSYRKGALSRPKEQNVSAFQREVERGSITPVFESAVKEIREREVSLQTGGKEKTIPNQAVFALLGSEIPIQFFRRSRIKMEGEKSTQWWVYLTAMVSFFTMLYYGKAGFSYDIPGGEGPAGSIGGYLSAPFSAPLAWGLSNYAWYGSLNFLLGWLGSAVFLGSGSLALIFMVKDGYRYFGTPWARIKYSYLTGAALLFTWVYFRNILGKDSGWVEPPTFWYSLLYTTTIILFGLRRMQVRPTRYIVYQTLTLMAVQTFFLFLLPFYLYDGVLVKVFAADSWLIREVFPQGKWSSFGLILFWPLNINNFGTSTFWTWFPFVQTFGILLLAVLKWGKGAYCGWICSCGAMAETLGDEYRTRTPHGPAAKKLENIGQAVLWWAFAATALYFASKHLTDSGSLLGDTFWGLYKFTIDVFFAGVLGLGVYFFMGGRVWCRFGCPLAALMHIYTRFSVYRIMANKKRCISCNICTKVCHMGIDVMNYANKGIPMNDAECVRCSACVVNCPMQVLTFGEVGKADPDNKAFKEEKIPLKNGWGAGLPEEKILMLLREEETKA